MEFFTYLEYLKLSFKIQQALNKNTKADESKDSKAKGKCKHSTKYMTKKDLLKYKRCGKWDTKLAIAGMILRMETNAQVANQFLHSKPKSLQKIVLIEKNEDKL